MKLNLVQKIYVITFLVSGLGIAGNLELNVETPFFGKLIFGISAFLTIVRIIVEVKRGK